MPARDVQPRAVQPRDRRPRDRHPYEWAVLRVVPRVERCEFVNAGVVLYCQDLDYLAAAVDLDEERTLALHPSADVAAVRRHLQAVVDLCAGAPAAGPNGRRAMGERFRWLVAPRSTVVQASPLHTGLTADPSGDLARLVDVMVRLPQDPGGGAV